MSAPVPGSLTAPGPVAMCGVNTHSPEARPCPGELHCRARKIRGGWNGARGSPGSLTIYWALCSNQGVFISPRRQAIVTVNHQNSAFSLRSLGSLVTTTQRVPFSLPGPGPGTTTFLQGHTPKDGSLGHTGYSFLGSLLHLLNSPDNWRENSHDIKLLTWYDCQLCLQRKKGAWKTKKIHEDL